MCNEERSVFKRKEKVAVISENAALRKRRADENENDLVIDERRQRKVKTRSSELSTLPLTKARQSFQFLMSNLREIMHNRNNKNDESNVEEVVSFEKRTQELKGNNDNNNNNNDDGDDNNNNNTSFMLIYLVIIREENEITQHSVQAKNEEKSPRLVMRADNVLKVILNVALFHGMHVERSQEKFIRLFAFEGNGDSLVHPAIKLSNSNEADNLYQAIKDAILPAHDRA
ncbi:hypothetical protein Glove_194g188 [Diversispora epigaea]|uniref:RanBD1 domain-containing protein n=1 Tax=Diversispora epigaea TaxID=1348612 RepID=A0A397IUX2_9GLOM|nr:hypothetical protein Glove_194g188 [Diversispora epigaea]